MSPEQAREISKKLCALHSELCQACNRQVSVTSTYLLLNRLTDDVYAAVQRSFELNEHLDAKR